MSIAYETRREAFESVDIKKMEDKVLSVLRQNGPMSAEQIMDNLGTENPNNVRPRLSGLKKKGSVMEVGKRRNRNGYNETIWEAVPQAEAEKEEKQ